MPTCRTGVNLLSLNPSELAEICGLDWSSSRSITVQRDLPESVAAEAQGLLDPHRRTRLVEREVELDMPMREGGNSGRRRTPLTTHVS